MEKEIKKCDKLESGLSVLFAGYIKKELSLKEKFEKIMNDNERLKIENEVFGVLE